MIGIRIAVISLYTFLFCMGAFAILNEVFNMNIDVKIDVDQFHIGDEIIKVGEVYVHSNGTMYKVLCFTNVNTMDPKKYPETVVYQNVINYRIYSRPTSDWFRSMEKVE